MHLVNEGVDFIDGIIHYMGNTLDKAVWLCNKKCIYRLESMHSKTNLDLLPIHRHVLVSTDGSVGGLLVEGSQNTQAVNKLGADSSRTSKVLEDASPDSRYNRFDTLRSNRSGVAAP